MFLLQIMGEGEALARADYNSSKSIYFLISLAVVMLPVLAQVMFPGGIRSLAVFSLNPMQLRQSYSDRIPGSIGWTLIVLLLFSWVSLGTLAYSLVRFGGNFNVLAPILLVMVFTVGGVFFTGAMSSAMLRSKSIFGLHVADQLLFIVSLGIVSYILLNVFWFARPEVFNSTLVVAAILVVLWLGLRVFRLLFLLPAEMGRSALFIFFYLCAVEIAPYILFGRIIINLN